MSPLRRLIFTTLKSTGVFTATSFCAFTFWTRNCHMEDLPQTDFLFRRASFAKFNPTPTPAAEMRDVCVRRYPLKKVRPELVEDARRGGPKLVESLAQGIWGGSGYTLQRLVLTCMYGSLPENRGQLWTRQSLLSSTYNVGTAFTDHIIVLEKTHEFIVFRAASSPRFMPDSPRDMDGLVEISAVPDFENGYVDFFFKTAFFAGTGYKGPEGSKFIPSIVKWAHRQYTKLLMEAAIKRVKGRGTDGQEVIVGE